MKFEGRWFWCYSCDGPAILCPDCENSSCNGGGCDKCHQDFEEVSRMIQAGEAPQFCQELPKRGGGMGILLSLDPGGKMSKEEFKIALNEAMTEFYLKQDVISGRAKA